jgi:hypothetical protein
MAPRAILEKVGRQGGHGSSQMPHLNSSFETVKKGQADQSEAVPK